MDAAEQAILSESPDTNASDDPWREKFKRHWLNVRGLAREAWMLDKHMRQSRIAQENAIRAANGTLGETRMPEEDDTIRIGDEVHNHYPSQSGSGSSATLKTLGTLALAALGGGGAAAFGPSIAAWMWPDEQVNVAPAEPSELPGIALDGGGLSLEIVRPNEP